MKRKMLVFTLLLVMLLTLTSATLVACGDKGEVTVTVYDTDGTTVLETFKLKKGDSLSEKELTFIKEGYTFAGVYTDKDFQTEYKPSEVSGATTLYAKFSKDTYYISFVNDGGESISRLEVKTGEDFELPTPNARAGYVFNGWKLDGEDFDDEDAYEFTDSIRLRASWSAKTTAVTYDVNGGVISAAGAATFTYGSPISLPYAQRTGYTLIGWAKEGTATVETNGTNWAQDVASITLKALWAANKTKVIFLVNGGTFASPEPEQENGNYYKEIVFDGNYTLPVATKTGYNLSWTIQNTATEIAATGTWNNVATSLTLMAKWTGKPYEITFDAKEGEIPNTAVSSIDTVYGARIGILPTPIAPAGYEFDGWYYKVNNVDTLLTASSTHSVDGDISAFAKYNKETDIAYAIEIYLENANDELYVKHDTINKKGETGATVDATAEYTADNYMQLVANSNEKRTGTIAGDGSLVLKLYYDRKSYSIAFDSKGGSTVESITKKYGEAISAPANPTRTGYEFSSWSPALPSVMPMPDGDNDEITLDASWTAKKYKLYYDVTLGYALTESSLKYDEALPYAEVEFGSAVTLASVSALDYTFVNWNKDGQPVSAIGNWSTDGNVTLKAVWAKAVKVNPSDTEVVDFYKNDTDKYFKDYDAEAGEYIYVFVNDGSAHTFTGATAISVEGNKASVSDNKLYCESLGNFKLTITAEGHTRTVSAKFVEYVDEFTRGTDYVSNWVFRDTANFLNNADDTYSKMQVGTANAFRPDMVITNGTESINSSEASIVFKVFEGATELTEGFTFANGELLLGNTLIGKTLTVKISPKYSFDNLTPAEFTLLVNDGYNVYDSNSFKLAYENNALKTINILRNFNIVLTEDKYGYKDGNKYVINDFEHCAYVRFAAEEETVTINCNYFTIDGSKMPYMDNRYDGKNFLGEAANINNVQSAIFGYSGRNKSNTASFPDAKLIINDMYLQGNNTKAADYVEAQYEGLDIYQMSGSYNGVRVENCGDLQLNNCTIKNTLIAVYASAYDGESTLSGGNYVISHEFALDYVLIDNSWANSFYAYGSTNVTLTNSKLLTSSGAAVHVEDIFDANYTGVNTVTIDAATEINNYVSGEEAWFVAYGMNAMIPTLKTNLNAGAQGLTNMLSGGGEGATVKGIIKTIDGAEYFNFAVFCRSAGGDSSDWATDVQQAVKMNIVYKTNPIVTTTIAEGTNAMCTSDFKYIDFELTAPGVGQVVFFVTLE